MDGQNTVTGKRNGSRPSESFNLFCMLEKKSLFCLRVTFFITVQLLRDGKWKNTPKQDVDFYDCVYARNIYRCIMLLNQKLFKNSCHGLSFSCPLAELVHINTAIRTSFEIRLILVSKALRSLHENYTHKRRSNLYQCKWIFNFGTAIITQIWQ